MVLVKLDRLTRSVRDLGWLVESKRSAPPLGLRRAELRDNAGRLVLERDDAELATVERIAELRSEGLPLLGIATRLDAEGHTTKRGGRWHASTVRAVLARVEETKAS